MRQVVIVGHKISAGAFPYHILHLRDFEPTKSDSFSGYRVCTALVTDSYWNRLDEQLSGGKELYCGFDKTTNRHFVFVK